MAFPPERSYNGKTKTKGELLEEDKAAFLPLPTAPFDASRKVSTCASSMSLVRFDKNDYSVPVKHARRLHRRTKVGRQRARPISRSS